MILLILFSLFGAISAEKYDPLPEEELSVKDFDILTWNMTTPAGMQASALAEHLDRKWPNGTVPYSLHSSITSVERRHITDAIREIEQKTCVRFEPALESDPHSVLIFKPPNPAKCNSFVGRQGNKQQVNLGSECYRRHIILHELMHVLGFIHEHNRADRDDYVIINWDNIIDGQEQNFKKKSEFNLTLMDTPYSYDSVMHYSGILTSKNNFSPTIVAKKSGVKLGGGDNLSPIDVVRINRYYKCGSAYESEEKKEKTQKNTIMIVGGIPNKAMLILSSNRSKWISLQLDLPYALGSGGAVYLNEEIYIFGGYTNPKALYKLDKNFKWIRLADMNIGRWWIAKSSMVWNGYIWVFGGANSREKSLKSVEEYDPKEDKWTLMPNMQYSRSRGAVALWNDTIIIAGGFTDIAEYFDRKNGNWVELPEMPKSLYFHSLVSYKGKLIIMGDADIASNKVWKLDPLGENWQPLPSMKYESHDFFGIILDEEIYVIGGKDWQGSELHSRVEIFNGKNWREGPSLPYDMWRTPAMIIPQDLADRLIAYKPEE